MNTGHKPTKILQCEKCPDTYMSVGDTIIGLAMPKSPTLGNHGQILTGTCPKHRRELGK